MGKKFDFVVSNNLEQISMEGQSNKAARKMLKAAFKAYFKAGLIAKFGEGKSKAKKEYKQAAVKSDGVMGEEGFVTKILTKPTDYDYFCAPSKGRRSSCRRVCRCYLRVDW